MKNNMKIDLLKNKLKEVEESKKTQIFGGRPVSVCGDCQCGTCEPSSYQSSHDKHDGSSWENHCN